MQDGNYDEELKQFCFEEGADLFGVADIKGMKQEFNLSPAIMDGLDSAVCIGVRLSSQVLADIVDKPTKLYFHHYRIANMLLDQLAFKVARWIQQRRGAALPIAASQVIDWQKQAGHVSHKKIGLQAGLGWIGRNNLLVNHLFGAQFRLTSVLTNISLKADKPIEQACGDCRACIDACPVGAIQENQKDFKHVLCSEKLKDFQRSNIVGQYICGVCVKSCKPKI